MDSRLIYADFTNALAKGEGFLRFVKFNDVQIEVCLRLFGNLRELFVRNAPMVLKGLQRLALFFSKEEAGSPTLRRCKIVECLRLWKFIENLLKLFPVNVCDIGDNFNAIPRFP